MDKLQLLNVLKENNRQFQSIPFWSWNDELDKNELLRQIAVMDDNGMGGFIMHARGGLKAKYLGEKWFDCIQACVAEAKKRNMQAWFYDENGWPSGFVGGELLKIDEYLARFLLADRTDEWKEANFHYIVEGNNFSRVFEPVEGREYVHIWLNKNLSNVDILIPEVTDEFIKMTHEEYYKRLKDDFGKTVKGFFTDEPQYFRYHTPFTPELENIFKDEQGIDVFDMLPMMFYEFEGCQAFRYKYWFSLHQLYINNFVKKIYNWCTDHNCMLTGHTIEENSISGQMWCCGGAMPFYEYTHIPCIDRLWRAHESEIPSKQVGSMAAQLGRNLVLTETFGCSGWDTSLKEFKWMSDDQYVNGVNMICQHLYQYRFYGMRKKDYPPAFSPHSPWFKELKVYNKYQERLGYLIANSIEYADTVLLHPMHSAYLTFKREDCAESVAELDFTFREVTSALMSHQIAHHFADEWFLRDNGYVKDGALVIGKRIYHKLVLPTLYNMDKSTLMLVKEFMAAGGPVCIYGKLPEYLEGESYDFSFLKSTTTLEKIAEKEPYSLNVKTADINSTVRDGEFGRFIYIINSSETEDYDLEIKADGMKNPCILSLEFLTAEAPEIKDGKALWTLEKMQSALLFLEWDDSDIAFKAEKGEKDSLSFKKSSDSGNYFNLDTAAVSFDGEIYSEGKPLPLITEELLLSRYQGEVWLKFTFELQYLPSHIELINEKMSIVESMLNGNTLSYKEGSPLAPEFLMTDIKDIVKQGENELIYKIQYCQREEVYYVLYDENVTESLKNCLYFDTEIENIYLYGDFGVFSKAPYIKGEQRTNLTDGGFYIDKTIYKEDSIEAGYPFFSGRMRYDVTVDRPEGDYQLKVGGRFAVLNFFIGDEKLVSSIFDETCTVHSDGKPFVVTVEAVSGNRNLYGPHHYYIAEPYGVAPPCFTFTGTWKDGKSEEYRDSYSFVDFGVTAITITELKK